MMLEPGKCTIKTTLIAGLAILALASFAPLLHSQANRSITAELAGGLAPSGGEVLYDGSFNLTARVGLTLWLTRRIGIAGNALLIEGKMFQGETPCLGGIPCPVNFGLRGAYGALNVGLGQPGSRAIRLSVGAGGFSIHDDQPNGNGLPTVTAFGVQMGLDALIWRRSRWGVAVGVRGIVVPDANGETLWFVPMEIGLRFW